MVDNRLYFFSGCGGEYVLHPIYNELLKNGYDALELTDQNSSDTYELLDKARYSKKDIIYLTSHHLFLNQHYYNLYQKNDKNSFKNIISGMAIKDYLNPKKSIFYPHDLLDGLTHTDRFYFKFFNLYLSPYHHLMQEVKRYCPNVEEVGWIKKKEQTKELNEKEPNDISFGMCLTHPGAYWTKEKGFSKYKDKFSIIWNKCKENLHIRMINDHLDNGKEFFCKEENLILDPLEESIFDFIDRHDIIITHGGSGVAMEAALSGRMVFAITDCGSEKLEKARAKWLGLPNTHLVTIKECAKYCEKILAGKEKVEKGKDLMKPFDMEKTIRLILNI